MPAAQITSYFYDSHADARILRAPRQCGAHFISNWLAER